MISATEPRPFAGTPPVEPGDDLTDPDIHARGVPLEAFVRLRRTAPVFWNCQDEETSGFDDGGLWMLSRYMDVKAVFAHGRDGPARRTRRSSASTVPPWATRSGRPRSR